MDVLIHLIVVIISRVYIYYHVCMPEKPHHVQLWYKRFYFFQSCLKKAGTEPERLWVKGGSYKEYGHGIPKRRIIWKWIIRHALHLTRYLGAFLAFTSNGWKAC